MNGPTEHEPCQWCKGPVARQKGERADRFLMRKFCSRKCRIAYVCAGNRKAPLPSKPQTAEAETESARVKIVAEHPDEAVARFMREHGITVCPPRFVAPTRNAQLADSVAAQKIAAIILAPTPSWKGK